MSSGPLPPDESRDASKEAGENESVLTPEERAMMNEVLSEPPTPSDSALRLLAESARTSEAARKIREQAEQAERVRSLEFFELQINPQSPEQSVDLLQHEELYNQHLLSDEAIARLMQGDESLYEEEMFLGCMMNRIKPLPREEAKYREIFEKANSESHNPIPYESVWDQHIADLVGAPGRMGRYRFFGMRDPATRKLVASLTLRQPPKEYGDARTNYMLDTEKAFQRVQFQPGWDEGQTIAQIPETGEIDTIIADREFRGAGMRLVYETLAQLQDEHDLPEHLMYYRSNGIAVEGPEGEVYPPGVNSSSFVFFVKKLGFTDMGDRSDAHDVMVREVVPGGELFIAKTRWTFGRKSTNRLLKRVADNVTRKNLVEGGSRLILPS